MFVDQLTYNRIKKSIPINAVELLVYNKDGDVLLFERRNEPAKYQWWLPGGRVMYGEKRSDTLSRLIKEECGIESFNVLSSEVIEYTVENIEEKVHQHVISTVYSVEVDSTKIILDDQSLSYKWDSPENLKSTTKHEFMQYVLSSSNPINNPSFIDSTIDKSQTGYLEEEFYQKILGSFSIPCVDVLINNEFGEILLVKRKNEPAKDEWWVPGGRVKYGERRIDAAQRKLKEECGLDGGNYSKTEVFDFIFEGDPLLHDIGTLFNVIVKKDEVILDAQSSDYKWLKPEQWLKEDISTFIKNLMN